MCVSSFFFRIVLGGLLVTRCKLLNKQGVLPFYYRTIRCKARKLKSLDIRVTDFLFCFVLQREEASENKKENMGGSRDVLMESKQRMIHEMFSLRSETCGSDWPINV